MEGCLVALCSGCGAGYNDALVVSLFATKMPLIPPRLFRGMDEAMHRCILVTLIPR